MNDLDLQPIRDRLAEATPGPWEYNGQGWVCHAGTRYDGAGVPDSTATIPTGDADATLIAHAPADLAALCDEVGRLRKVAEAARLLLEQCDYDIGGYGGEVAALELCLDALDGDRE